ncbi:MAG: sulfatase-like hydrolase/transferase [Phycisphaeraceae bacterium]|nr:sulfatase-like hydrolase/transferase [Phycisphaeraceae bacterium]
MSFRRNLIIVLAHGLRNDALGDAGSWPLATPNIDALSNRGIRLVATSATPADPGAMTSLLTGRHARQHGLLTQRSGAPACDGWAAALAAEGYHTVGVGTVAPIARHLKEAVIVHDVDSQDVGSCAYLKNTRSKGLTAAVLHQRRQRLRRGPFEPDRLVMDPADDVDGFIMQEAARQLVQLPGDKPWALIVMLTGPGNDLAPPALGGDLISPDSLEDGWTMPDFTRLDQLAELDYPRSFLQRVDPTRLARIRADYLGRVSLLDFAMARLAMAMDERIDQSRTWMLLASDRGCLLGEHGLIGHRSFFGGSVETPFVLVPPRKPAKPVSEGTLLSTVDVAATIAELGGAELEPAAAGRSVLPMLRQEEFRTLTAGACISEYSQRILLETERYKVSFDTARQTPLTLFDMLGDTDEQDNLVQTIRGRNLLEGLRIRLADALMPVRADGPTVAGAVSIQAPREA